MRVGIEVELISPRGATRQELATLVASRAGGSTVAGWHLDSEPAAHESIKTFHHMTPAFDVFGATGDLIVRIVDDITLRRDLDSAMPANTDWVRVLSDDPRFLRILEATLPTTRIDADVLAELVRPMGMLVDHSEVAERLLDNQGASIAMIAALPGERERGAELISPILTGDRQPWIDQVLGAAQELGFTVPHEGAIHLHYDAELFRHLEILRRLVATFGEHADGMRTVLATNPNCTRIGRLPEAFCDAVMDPALDALPWQEIAESLDTTGVTKYLDVNLTGLLVNNPKLDTVEIRTLPATNDPNELGAMVARVDEIVERLIAPT